MASRDIRTKDYNLLRHGDRVTGTHKINVCLHGLGSILQGVVVGALSQMHRTRVSRGLMCKSSNRTRTIVIIALINLN